MTTQAIAALITFVGIAVMLGVFLFVLLNSREEAPYEDVQPRAYAIR